MKALYPIFAVVALIIAASTVYYFGKYIPVAHQCWSDWTDTDYEWRVKKLTCQVKHPTGGWLPAKNVRFSE